MTPLSTIPAEPTATPPLGAVAQIPPPPPVGGGTVPYWRSALVVGIVALIVVFSWTKPHATLVPQSGVVMHLPSYVAVGTGFVGATAEVSEAEHYILPKDTEFARKDYSDYPGHDQIFCGIVLSGATNQSIHRPEVCLVAQGWNITNQEDISIKMESGHILTVRNLTVKRTVMVRDKPITLVNYNMYWFVGEKVTTPYHYMRIFLSSWDRIVYNRAHRWAYVTVSSRINQGLISGGLDATQTRTMMIDFIRKIVPTFQKSEMSGPVAAE